MTQIDKPTGVFIDWGNLKKETARIGKNGEEISMPSDEEKPKNLNDLLKRRAERNS